MKTSETVYDYGYVLRVTSIAGFVLDPEGKVVFDGTVRAARVWLHEKALTPAISGDDYARMLANGTR